MPSQAPKRGRRPPSLGSSGPPPNAAWDIHYFKRHVTDDASETVPGQTFLNGLKAAIAAQFRAVLIAVATAPPHKFAGGGKWEAMHDEMSGIYEIRVDGPPKRTHYRLFCLLDRAGRDDKGNALPPMLVILDGDSKPFRTEMPAKVYQRVDKLRHEYLAREARSLA